MRELNFLTSKEAIITLFNGFFVNKLYLAQNYCQNLDKNANHDPKMLEDLALIKRVCLFIARNFAQVGILRNKIT